MGPGQQSTFTNVALICLAIGAVTSVVFHACIKVVDNVQPLTNSIGNFNELNEQNRHQGEFSDNMKMKNWFKQPQFYQVEKPVSMAADKNIDSKMAIRLKERSLQVAVIYMSSQLYINIYQSFYPFFLEDTLHMSATAVASIPLAMFIAGFAVSRYDHTQFWPKKYRLTAHTFHHTTRLTELLTPYANQKAIIGAAFLVGLSTCVWINFGNQETLKEVGKNYLTPKNILQHQVN